METASEKAGAPDKVPGYTFDKRVTDIVHDALVQAFQEHGDSLRSVGVFFDYYGGLNETPDLQKGIWLGPQGPVNSPDAVIGSMQGVLHLLREITRRAFALEAHVRESLQTLLTELREASEKVEGAQNTLKENHGENS